MRSYTAQNQLIGALRDEILARLTASTIEFPSDTLEICLQSLCETLQQQRISIDRVATDGRKLAECIAETLLKEQGIAQPKGRLADHTNELRRRGLTAPWIISHLDCLRAFGNEGVHLSDEVTYRPPRLRDDDLVPILASLQRVIDFFATRD